LLALFTSALALPAMLVYWLHHRRRGLDNTRVVLDLGTPNFAAPTSAPASSRPAVEKTGQIIGQHAVPCRASASEPAAASSFQASSDAGGSAKNMRSPGHKLRRMPMAPSAGMVRHPCQDPPSTRAQTQACGPVQTVAAPSANEPDTWLGDPHGMMPDSASTASGSPSLTTDVPAGETQSDIQPPRQISDFSGLHTILDTTNEDGLNPSAELPAPARLVTGLPSEAAMHMRDNPPAAPPFSRDASSNDSVSHEICRASATVTLSRANSSNDDACAASVDAPRPFPLSRAGSSNDSTIPFAESHMVQARAATTLAKTLATARACAESRTSEDIEENVVPQQEWLITTMRVASVKAEAPKAVQHDWLDDAMAEAEPSSPGSPQGREWIRAAAATSRRSSRASERPQASTPSTPSTPSTSPPTAMQASATPRSAAEIAAAARAAAAAGGLPRSGGGGSTSLGQGAAGAARARARVAAAEATSRQEAGSVRALERI